MESKDGMGGAPIIVKNNKVIGIQKLRMKEGKGKGARLITAKMILHLHSWRKYLNGSSFKV